MGKLRDGILGPELIISARRSPLLTRSCHEMLVMAARLYPEHTIDRYKPGGVWVDWRRFGVGTLRKALELCIVSPGGSAGACTYYELNEEAYKILADPDYKPLITRALSGAERSFASALMSV